MALSVVSTAMFSAISIVWDREFGFLREMLVAPASRAALVLGKAAGGAAAHQRFPTGVEVFGHTLGTAIELAVVAVFAAVFLALAVRAFSRTK